MLIGSTLLCCRIAEFGSSCCGEGSTMCWWVTTGPGTSVGSVLMVLGSGTSGTSGG